jgi:hypothetical protein
VSTWVLLTRALGYPLATLGTGSRDVRIQRTRIIALQSQWHPTRA